MIKKLKSKKVIIVSIMILLTSVLMLSYATFVVTTSDYKASELLVSELTYSLAIYEEGSTTPISGNIIISPNTTKIYNLEIRSINKIDSKYTLAYKKEDNITVKYSNRTSWSTEDYIKDYNSNNIKKVRIVVENTSNEEKNVEIKIFGGYRYNDYIKIDTKGYTRITEEYDEELLASSELLNEIVHEETKCESDRCIYGGGSKSNYLSYSNNLYRIIGTYTLNNEKVTKIISENITPTTNIKEDLNNIYNTLENKDDIIYKTNKFNCTETACTETEYENIGLLTKYEYDLIGGENSYLKNNESYYVLNGATIETQNGSGLGSLKPVIYLPERTRVTGSGTIKDPYKIKTSDINIIAYTLNGEPTDLTYETLTTNNYSVNKIDCENGTQATWDYEEKSLKFENLEVPEYCTIDFKYGHRIILIVRDDNKINEYETIVEVGKNAIFIPEEFKESTSDAWNTSMACDGATMQYNEGVITISDIDKSQTCIIETGIVTFTLGSTCPSLINNNSDACYILSHEYGGKEYYGNSVFSDSFNDWNNMVTYHNKTYKNCTINSYTIQMGTVLSGCTNNGEITDASRLLWNNNELVWYIEWGAADRIASCTVNLTCKDQ